MSRIAYAALGRPGSFARDGRYAKPQVPEEPAETEDTFAGNARIKAHFAAKGTM